MKKCDKRITLEGYMNRKVIYASLQTVIVSIILFAAFLLENPSQNRSIILLFISCGFLIATLPFYLLSNKYAVYFLTIQIFLLFLLEMNSRYAINYFYHILYFIILLQSILLLNRNVLLFHGIIIILFSSVKFVQLILLDPVYFNIAISLFFISTNLFFVIIGLLAKYYAMERNKTETLNNELLTAYRQLRDYQSQVREKAVIEERSRIARELHDHLGHQLTASIMQAEIISGQCTSEDPKLLEQINGLKSLMREQLRQVRQIVSTLKTEEGLSVENLLQVLREFEQNTGITVGINIEKEINHLEIRLVAQLIPIIKECLTNAAKHGKVTYIFFEIKQQESYLMIKIKDNGTSKGEFKAGNGLNGIRERLALLGGVADFSQVEGFEVSLKIPR